MKRIYISGQVTGRDFNTNNQQFRDAEIALNDLGYQAVNPFQEVRDWLYGNPTHQEAMKFCIHILTDCDGVALLPGWQDSAGALLEHTVAYECGMEIRPLAGWLR